MKILGLVLVALFAGVLGASIIHVLITSSGLIGLILITVAMGGVAGGFTLGLIGGERYGLKLPGKVGHDKKVDPGFLGDVFVGVMAAFLGIGVATQTLRKELFSLPAASVAQSTSQAPISGAFIELLLLNFCIAYISGFLGLRLVKGLSERFLQEAKLKDKLEQVDHNEGATAYLTGQSALGLGSPHEAEDYFKRAFQLDKGNEVRSLLGLARAYKRQGRYLDALTTVDEAISRKSNRDTPERMAAAYWNRACYRALLLNKSKARDVGTTDDVIQDLEESLRLQPDFRDDLLNEKDLTSLRENGRFKLLVEAPSATSPSDLENP